MARHRQNEDDQTMLLPLTVEQSAASQRVVRARPPRRLVVLAVAGVVLVSSAAAWLLSPQANPDRLGPSVAGTAAKSNVVIEGLGEVSAAPLSAPAANPRVSPGIARPSATPPAVQVQILPLLAHYPFDETSGTSASDAAAPGKTATVAGAAKFVAGRTGNAIEFASAGQYVSLPAGILSGTPEFTVATWVRLDTIGTWSRVFDFGSGTTTYMFLTPRSDAGRARFSITTGGSGKQQRIDAPAPLPVGAWTHVAVTLSGGTGILYVNRIEVARTSGMTLTSASLGSTTQNWIGRSQYQADPFLDGQVDDLRIYSRALSAAELATLP